MSNDDIYTSLIIPVQWGGYYSDRRNGEYSAFRLLDFNTDGYHIQLFREKFSHQPSFDEVKNLRPYILHAALDIADILNGQDVTLIGKKVLDEQTLSGYADYLRELGADEPVVIDDILGLIEYSEEPPMNVKISKIGDHIDVIELE